MTNIFSKNYSEEEELYFVNKEQLMKYVANIAREDIKAKRISTISELYK